jgi:hypothetical protein
MLHSPEREDKSGAALAGLAPAEAARYALEQCRTWLMWSAVQIEACLNGEVAAREQLLVSLSEMLGSAINACPDKGSDKLSAVIVAIQSHDRLQQRLNHVVQSLRALHEHIGDPDRAESPESWRVLRDTQFRAFSMREERVLFAALVAEHDESTPEADLDPESGVDLFTVDGAGVA